MSAYHRTTLLLLLIPGVFVVGLGVFSYSSMIWGFEVNRIPSRGEYRDYSARLAVGAGNTVLVFRWYVDENQPQRMLEYDYGTVRITSSSSKDQRTKQTFRHSVVRLDGRLILVMGLLLCIGGGYPILRQRRVRVHRMRNGLCERCGYDVAKCVSTACPECGNPIPEPRGTALPREN